MTSPTTPDPQQPYQPDDVPYIPAQPPYGTPYPQPPMTGWHQQHTQPQPPNEYPQSPAGPPPWPGQVPTGGPHRPTPTMPPTVPVPPPRKGMSTGKLLLIIGAVAVGLCCVGGTILAAVAPKTANTASSTVRRDVAPTPTKAAASTAPATPAAATKPAPPPVPTTKAAPVDPKAQAAAAVRVWFDGGGDTRLQAISDDFGAFHDAGTKGDIAAISAAARDACTSLQKDVESAQAYKPIPDDRAQRSWAAALASFARAATDCVAGVDTVSADLIDRANGEMTDGTASLNEVTARVNELAHG